MRKSGIEAEENVKEYLQNSDIGENFSLAKGSEVYVLKAGDRLGRNQAESAWKPHHNAE